MANAVQCVVLDISKTFCFIIFVVSTVIFIKKESSLFFYDKLKQQKHDQLHLLMVPGTMNFIINSILDQTERNKRLSVEVEKQKVSKWSPIPISNKQSSLSIHISLSLLIIYN